MLRTLIPLIAIACVGCTRVAVDEPIGKPMAQSDLEELAGEWIGDKEVIYTMTLNDSPGSFTATWLQDGEVKTATCLITMPGDTDTGIVWVKDEELNAFLPLRATGGDDSITLLTPDEDEVKELVAAGKIQGSFDEEENAWLLSPEGIEELLVGKQFWNLGRSIPFLKKQKSGESEEPVPESEL
jgi:hypothetical protein